MEGMTISLIQRYTSIKVTQNGVMGLTVHWMQSFQYIEKHNSYTRLNIQLIPVNNTYRQARYCKMKYRA